VILEQLIWKARKGRRDDLVALGKAECERRGVPYRIYTPITHPGNVVIFEFQFEDMAEHAKSWARWNTEPEAQEFVKQLRELVELEHHTELYKVL
jgi:hypothetical protein